jgi:four helix bundle protein
METSQLLFRTNHFALEIIRFFKILSKTEESRIIGKQLLRSSTSVAANYRAACRARSKQEFYAKLCIVLEEIDESLFWLELLDESKLILNSELFVLKKEAEELLYIFSASRKTAKMRL